MMTIAKLVLARYFHKPLSTLLSIILFAIGVAVISLVIKAEYYLENNYRKNLAGIDLVVGAKGSPLQLILSSVLHIDSPTGNISLEEVRKIERNPLVKSTIPVALGDNYKGFRIVGTETDYAGLYKAELLEGKMFEKPLDAVVGANVTKKAKLKLNDNFAGVHGVMHEGHSHDEYEYTVTGILMPTGSVVDNLILTPVESVWMVHSSQNHEHESEEHDHDHAEEAHDHNHGHNDEAHDHTESGELVHNHDQAKQSEESIDNILHKIEHQEELTEEEVQIYNTYRGILTDKKQMVENQITALFVFYQNPMAAATLPRMINENTTLQAASPALEFNRLQSLLGYGITLLRLLAWIIITISGINIFIYLLNTINQSIGEIALLRATGVSRNKIFLLILLQGMFLSVLGWLTGICAAIAIWQMMPLVDSSEVLNAFMIKKDILLLLYCLGIAVLAGILPALKIYKTKIHYLLSK
jgi:putative ABC transport system permease protein